MLGMRMAPPDEGSVRILLQKRILIIISTLFQTRHSRSSAGRGVDCIWSRIPQYRPVSPPRAARCTDSANEVRERPRHAFEHASSANQRLSIDDQGYDAKSRPRPLRSPRTSAYSSSTTIVSSALQIEVSRPLRRCYNRDSESRRRQIPGNVP